MVGESDEAWLHAVAEPAASGTGKAQAHAAAVQHCGAALDALVGCRRLPLPVEGNDWHADREEPAAGSASSDAISEEGISEKDTALLWQEAADQQRILARRSGCK